MVDTTKKVVRREISPDAKSQSFIPATNSQISINHNTSTLGFSEAFEQLKQSQGVAGFTVRGQLDALEKIVDEMTSELKYHKQ